MFREIRRSTAALAASTPAAAGAGAGEALPISKTRAIMQIVLTAGMAPLCLWVLFGRSPYGESARNSASALLGAIVTYWMKD